MAHKPAVGDHILYWSPADQVFQDGLVQWISPRQNLIGIQRGSGFEFLTDEQLRFTPCGDLTEEEFRAIPPADPQDRLDEERYLRVLASAYPNLRLLSVTLLEAIRTSCHTGRRWRTFYR